MVTKICMVCGKEFEAKRNTAKYCGNTCKVRAKRGTKLEVQCPICGKIFHKTGKKLYCNNDCAEWAQKLNQTHGHYQNKVLYKDDTGAWED